jgi:hypothetical protein
MYQYPLETSTPECFERSGGRSRVGNPVLQHLSGACCLAHPEKRSRWEEIIPSSTVTVKK